MLRGSRVTALILLSKRVGCTSDAQRYYWASQLVGKEIASFNDILWDEYRTIWDAAYPNGVQDDSWEPGQAFIARSCAILAQYLEDLGQMKLF